MKRLMILLLALMMLSPSVVAAQEMTWSEGFDPSSPDCEVYAEDCENLIAWLTSQDGVEAPTPTPTPASVDAPMGGWAFVEDYRLRMMDAAEFICQNPRIQTEIHTAPLILVVDQYNSRETWDLLYPGTMDEFFALQEQLENQLILELEAGTPMPDEAKVPDHAFTVMEILEYLELERGYDSCNSIDVEL